MARISYNDVAKDYRAGRGLNEDGLSAWREAVRPYLEGLRLPLVDVGSGAGQFAPLFAEWFEIEVFGVEPSDGMRAQAIESAAHERVRYLAGDAQHLPLQDASCGAAWISTVIHHIPDLGAAAREVRRVLAPGAASAHPQRVSRPHRAVSRCSASSRKQRLSWRRSRASNGWSATSWLRASRWSASRLCPQVTVGSLREFRERVALRADTTLRGISDDAFSAGLRRLDAAIESESDPEPLIDYLDLAVLR